MKSGLYLIFLLTTLAFCHTVQQSDWSGGNGTSGPVASWGDRYDSSTRINDIGGSLRLISDVIEYNVTDKFVGAYAVHTADLNGDGHMDIVGAAYTASEISWWENVDGSGTSWTEHSIKKNYSGAHSVYAGDIDNDGDMDVLGAAGDGKLITFWENTDGTGTNWTEHILTSNFDGPSSVSAADINSDGKLDVLGTAAYDGDIIWWENVDGTGSEWIEHSVEDSFSGAFSGCVMDIDGDKDMDILASTRFGRSIFWWENTDGTGSSWAKHLIDNRFDGAASVNAIDIDGDGDTDVLGASMVLHNITWWENTDGSGTEWTKHQIETGYRGATAVYAADMDNDGDTDAIGAAFSDNEITWWENTDGSGTKWATHTVSSKFKGAMAVFVDDIDNDGNLDILGTASRNGEIAWWSLANYPTAGSLQSSILDVGNVIAWEKFSSSVQEPAGTSIGFQFRSSRNSSTMGAWSDTLFTAGASISNILADSTGFVQYKIILQTSDPHKTPVLQDIEFTCTAVITGVSEEPVPWDLASMENPSYGHISALISVPEQGVVSLTLYDVSGRVVAGSSQQFPVGTHSITFNNITHGVYFCVMTAENFTGTKRMIVLE